MYHEILNYMQVNTLLTCRLVNRYWNENSIPMIQIKTRKSLTLKSYNFLKFYTDFENAKILPITKLEVELNGLIKIVNCM